MLICAIPNNKYYDTITRRLTRVHVVFLLNHSFEICYKKVFSAKDSKVISSRSAFYLRAVEGNFRGLQISNG